MSRSGYSEDCETDWAWICWRGAVNSGINGKRGQKLLKELLVALDEMRDKKLIANDLVSDGQYCALGVVGKKRDINLNELDPQDSELVAKQFDISNALAREIVFMNDEGGFYSETPHEPGGS
jgi:hypothetical protein